jgi:hypothetical protein
MTSSRRRVWLVLALALAVVVIALFPLRNRSEERALTPPAPSPVEHKALPSLATDRAPHITEESDPSGGAVVGHVFNAFTGDGISGAQVTLAQDGGAAMSSETDASGAFSFRGLSPGSYTLVTASASDFLPFAPEWGNSPISVAVRANMRVSGIAVFLTPSVTYTGIVEDAAGARVPGAEIRLREMNQGEGTTSALPDHLVSDASGEFVFRAPDRTVIEARHPSRGIGRARLDQSARVSRRIVITLSAQPDAAIRGTASITGSVVDASGAPVPEPLVSAAPIVTGMQQPRVEVRGTEEGRFRIDGIDPGRYVVWVVCEGCTSSRIRTTTGEDVTLVVGRGGVIRGRVVDAASLQAVPAFALHVSRKRGPLDAMLEERAVTDVEGRFTVRGVSAGSYSVRAIARGHAPSPQIPVQVTDGVDTPEIIVKLTVGGTIRGTVSDRSSSKPLAGVLVAVEGDPGSTALMSPPAAVTTIASGAFVLTGVMPGVHSLRASAQGYHMTMATGVQVAEGAESEHIELTLEPTRAGEDPKLEFSGLGARLRVTADALVVEEVLAGSGAQAAGLAVGDGIVKVDGVLVTDLGAQNAVDRLRGIVGTRVALSVRHPNSASTILEVIAERRIVHY